MDTDPTVITRREALHAGDTDRALRNGVRNRQLVRLRRGSYIPAGEVAEGDAEAVHRAQIRATMTAVRPDAVVSHVSAAVLHGFSIWSVDLRRVHVTKNKADGGHVTPGLHTHCAPLCEDECTTVDGMLVTSVGRTLVDLGRTLPFEQVVVMADSALRQQLITRDELAGSLELRPRRRGVKAARRALDFADGRSESVGESRSRVIMHRHGLPAPTLQYVVRGHEGQQIARTDFCFEAAGVVGEFDGKAKYVRYLQPGELAADVVFREKRREDAIRAENLQVVRWGWAELDHPQEWIGQLGRALGTAH